MTPWQKTQRCSAPWYPHAPRGMPRFSRPFLHMYSDFVITVKCSQERRTCEMYRSRTGTLIFTMLNGKVIAADYEIDFVTERMKRKFSAQ